MAGSRFAEGLRLDRMPAPSNPATGQDAIWADANGKIIAQDLNGVKNFLSRYQLPDSWTTWGHSYFQYLFGTFYQSGRADALFRSALDIEFTNWRNKAINGAEILREDRWYGGWAKVMQEVVKPQRGAPYVSDGGATLLLYGINDVGATPGTQAQIRAMYANALRAVISRVRASVFYDNSFNVGAGLRTNYGAGFANYTTGVTPFASSGLAATPALRRATSTTSATITLTLPSDYAGEPVVVQFIAEPSATAGGTVTFSGTAGVTGTLTTVGSVPAAATGRHIPVVRRITNLTASNAGQTIIMTATSVVTEMFFDGWWLETNYPPPVLVANCARVRADAQAGYANAPTDTDIANLNATIISVVGEFDAMVQIADIDTALAKTTAFFGADGLHPNELGAARIADAFLYATNSLVPTNPAYPTLNMNTSSPRASSVRKPRYSGAFYSVEAQEATVDIAPVAGDIRWAPFLITEGREKYIRAGLRLAAGGSAAGTIRWGIYDDVDWKGYPQNLIAEIPNVGGAAFSVGTAAGAVFNPASGTGSISWEMDPGLYWLAFKFDTAGTGQAYECFTGPDRYQIMATINPGDLASLDHPICFVQGGNAAGPLPTQFNPNLGLFPNFAFPKFCLQAA
jgi:lysophospholipase L1-like esterase